MILLLCAASCAGISPRGAPSTGLRGAAFVRGTVLAEGQGGDAWVVVLYAVQGMEGRILDYQVVEGRQSFGFLVPEGGWAIAAFSDKNGNGKRDEGEPTGFLGPVNRTRNAWKNAPATLSLRITDGKAVPSGYPLDLARFGKSRRGHAAGPGGLGDLGNRVFSRPYGKKGLWDPRGFLEEVGGGIYFLGPYREDRIPVLFIHGSGGTPRDWRCLMDEWEMPRYQPWFFYYPTGVRLEEIVRWLHWEICVLQERYGFGEISIVAHSMGGLVAREFINRTRLRGGPGVPVFISISTPWGGLRSAGFGSLHSPVKVPSWQDLAPGSAFIKGLHRVELGPKTRHYLLYGYGSYATPVTPGGDGVVAVKSVLAPPARKEAHAVYAFKDRHGTILCNAQVVERCLRILRESAESAVNSEKTM